ncbi:hypothetical protein WJX73_008846 [Symbiochloris irregularis]|uniref:Uncharacterized protein n=1 Tax=Symbiochloris irregularis TaxID=706552 RepID=A0AAW1P8X7_9CHLO
MKSWVKRLQIGSSKRSARGSTTGKSLHTVTEGEPESWTRDRSRADSEAFFIAAAQTHNKVPEPVTPPSPFVERPSRQSTRVSYDFSQKRDHHSAPESDQYLHRRSQPQGRPRASYEVPQARVDHRKASKAPPAVSADLLQRQRLDRSEADMYEYLNQPSQPPNAGSGTPRQGATVLQQRAAHEGNSRGPRNRPAPTPAKANPILSHTEPAWQQSPARDEAISRPQSSEVTREAFSPVTPEPLQGRLSAHPAPMSSNAFWAVNAHQLRNVGKSTAADSFRWRRPSRRGWMYENENKLLSVNTTPQPAASALPGRMAASTPINTQPVVLDPSGFAPPDLTAAQTHEDITPVAAVQDPMQLDNSRYIRNADGGYEVFAPTPDTRSRSIHNLKDSSVTDWEGVLDDNPVFEPGDWERETMRHNLLAAQADAQRLQLALGAARQQQSSADLERGALSDQLQSVGAERDRLTHQVAVMHRQLQAAAGEAALMDRSPHATSTRNRLSACISEILNLRSDLENEQAAHTETLEARAAAEQRLKEVHQCQSDVNSALLAAQAQGRMHRQQCAQLQEAVNRLEADNLRLYEQQQEEGLHSASSAQLSRLASPSEEQLNRRIAELTDNLTRQSEQELRAVRNGQDLSAQLQATQQDLARAQAKCVRLDEVEALAEEALATLESQRQEVARLQTELAHVTLGDQAQGHAFHSSAREESLQAEIEQLRHSMTVAQDDAAEQVQMLKQQLAQKDALLDEAALYNDPVCSACQVKDRELQELKLEEAMRAEEESQLKRLRAHEGLNGSMVPAGQARDLQLQVQELTARLQQQRSSRGSTRPQQNPIMQSASAAANLNTAGTMESPEGSLALRSHSDTNLGNAGHTPRSIRSTQGSVARLPTAFEKQELPSLHDTAMRHGLHDTMDVSLDGTRFTDMAGELDTMDGMASVFSESSSEGLSGRTHAILSV